MPCHNYLRRKDEVRKSHQKRATVSDAKLLSGNFLTSSLRFPMGGGLWLEKQRKYASGSEYTKPIHAGSGQQVKIRMAMDIFG